MSKPFLALLRGINVGGKNIIGKEDLKNCFEELGFTSVKTYIQSGNILFRSTETSIRELTNLVEKGLSQRFEYEAEAVVLSKTKYDKAVALAPPTWGTDDEFKHNALFVLGSNTSKGLLKKLPEPKPDIEMACSVPGVIFWSISKQQQMKTSLMKISGLPEYQKVTVRNHNTVFRLQELLEEL